MNSFITDLKHTWNKPDNGLSKLIIINVVVYVLMGLTYLISNFTVGKTWFYEHIFSNIALPPSLGEFILKPWTLFTYFFSHSVDDFFHILFNMLILYWFGSIFTQFKDDKKLVSVYILGGLAGGIAYLIIYALFPQLQANTLGMVGASGAVYAIVVAATTVSPNFQINLLFFGPVRIKYIAAIYIFISLIGTTGSNVGGNIAHLFGALMGYTYVKTLDKGTDLGKPIHQFFDWISGLFKKRPKLKVTYRANENIKQGEEPDQKLVDAILDKISVKGYEGLTKEEKQILFKASQKK